jgi:hypothetical protein
MIAISAPRAERIGKGRDRASGFDMPDHPYDLARSSGNAVHSACVEIGATAHFSKTPRMRYKGREIHDLFAGQGLIFRRLTQDPGASR